MLRKLLPLLGLLVALPAYSISIPFTAAINQAQVVPPTGSSAFGTGVFTLDDVSHLLDLSIVVTNVLLSSGETKAQIHGPGASGANGPAIADLPLGSTKLASLDLSLLAACSSNVGSCESDLKAGLWYVLVSTSSFSGGEVRGQINPVSVVNEATGFSMLLIGMVGLGGFHWLVREKPIH